MSWLGPKQSKRGRSGGLTWKPCWRRRLVWRVHCSNSEKGPGSCRYASKHRKVRQDKTAPWSVILDKLMVHPGFPLADMPCMFSRPQPSRSHPTSTMKLPKIHTSGRLAAVHHTTHILCFVGAGALYHFVIVLGSRTCCVAQAATLPPSLHCKYSAVPIASTDPVV